MGKKRTCGELVDCSTGRRGNAIGYKRKKREKEAAAEKKAVLFPFLRKFSRRGRYRAHERLF